VDLGRIKGADGTDKWFGTVMAAGFDSLSPTGQPDELAARPDALQRRDGRRAVQVRLLPFRLTFDGESWTRS